MTNSWTTPGAAPTRPGWAQVLGWYVAGAGTTSACFAVSEAVAQAMRGASVGTLVWLLGLAEVAGLVTIGRGRPRRCRVALGLGAATPVVLVGLLVLWLIWAFAHSNWQF